MTRNRFTDSVDVPERIVGYPHDKPVVGIHEASAKYFERNADCSAPVSKIHHLYHFLDGVLQSCHITTYPFRQHAPGVLPIDTVRSIEVWGRPSVPEPWVFDDSLKNCQRRYTHLDQIYAISRYHRDERKPGIQPQSNPILRTDSQDTLDPQHTIDLSRRHAHSSYRHPGDP